MSKQFLDNSGLQKVADNVNTRLKTVTEMPSTANPGAVRLYVGETTSTYTKGHIYQYNNETYYCYIADDSGYYYHFYINEIKVGATVYACGAPEWFQKKADSISELTSDFSELGYSFSITAASPSSVTVSNAGLSIVANHSSEDDLSNIGWTDITASGGGTVDINFNPLSDNAQSGIAVSQALKMVIEENTTTDWEDAPWYGDFTGYGVYIWTDGDTFYYSDNDSQYVLNKSTMTWEPKTWYGLTSFDGSKVWTDGTDVYYSSESQQYVLNKATSTWEPKTWQGFTELHGNNIWTDGTNIYYSSGSTQKVLNKATDTWEPKTWQGYNNLSGSYVWTDGTNIYYSSNSTQKVLNKATDTWEEKTWNGLSDFRGDDVWTDGTNIYYSYYDVYTLDKATDTWEITNPWGSYKPSASYVWKMDNQIYASAGDYEQKQMIRVVK